jgi:hypothetical protein
MPNAATDEVGRSPLADGGFSLALFYRPISTELRVRVDSKHRIWAAALLASASGDYP